MKAQLRKSLKKINIFGVKMDQESFCKNLRYERKLEWEKDCKFYQKETGPLDPIN